LYGIAAFGGRHGHHQVLGAAAIEQAREGQGSCVDLVLGAGLGGAEMEFALGFGLGGPRGSYGPNPGAFGHDGYGGSCGFADPENEIAAGYVMNRMGPLIMDDPRKMALVEAVYAVL
jgi:CubicO group peptidase (beta-lactamase class C family)